MEAMSAHVLIAGAGHAGGRVAQQLRVLGHRGTITLVGEEPHAPYERPALSKELLLGTRSAAELTLAPSAFWDAVDDHLRRVHAAVRSVDGQARATTLSDGRQIAFDKLVVATGGHARKLDIPGTDLPQVRSLRTLDDSHALRGSLTPGSRLVVVGAGVIGMEAAASARTLGVEVTVLEAGARTMARVMPPTGSAWIDALHRANGVHIHHAVQVTAFEPQGGDGVLVHALRADGTAFVCPADTVLVAVGIVPATDFLAGSGVAVDNGVRTDGSGRSVSAPWCFAVGDVACCESLLYQRPLRQETWRNAENQAQTVAAAVLGLDHAPYAEIPWMWTDQYGHNIQVVGLYSDEDPTVQRGDPAAGGSWLWTHDGHVAGGMLVDNGRERKPLEALVRGQASVDPALLGDTATSLKAMA